MFTALHSLNAARTTLHADTCKQVATKQRGAVRERLSATTVDEAREWLAEPMASTGRKLVVCECAKQVPK